jgi:hypothetical protein
VSNADLTVARKEALAAGAKHCGVVPPSVRRSLFRRMWWNWQRSTVLEERDLQVQPKSDAAHRYF